MVLDGFEYQQPVSKRIQRRIHRSNESTTGEGRTAMLIQTVTTVGFHLPDEYEAEQSFRLNNDMHQWKRYEDTQYTYYVKAERSTVTWR